jgi:teichuronic acid biosynthesis glycosyltransferase TuaG
MIISISVVIPTFNRENLLLRAIKSALCQTYPVTEILVCDDGSDDNSFDSIKELNNPKIKWINCGRNGRPAIPRNLGIRESKSEWIAFLDSDDEWLPDKIESQVQEIIKNGALAICTNANRIIQERNYGNYSNFHRPKIMFNDLIFSNNIICSSVLINKSIIESTSLFSENEELKAIEDYDLWFKISTRVDFFYINIPLLNYYDNPSISIRKDSKSQTQIRKIIFKSFLIWKANFTLAIPNYDDSRFQEAKRNTIHFQIRKISLRIVNYLKRLS